MLFKIVIDIKFVSAYACTPEAYETAVKGFEEKLRHQSSKQHHSSDGNIKPMSSGRYNSVDVEVDLLENLTTSTDCGNGCKCDISNYCY